MNPILNLPNLLTMCRIVVVPFLIVIFLYTTNSRFMSLIVAFIFSIASLTDWLDGYIARRQGIETTLGKFLDPLADKLLVSVALIMLVKLGRAPTWMVTIIIAREIIITGLRGIAATERIDISPSRLGKYKTAFQIMAVVCLLIHFKYRFLSSVYIDFHALGIIILWIALIVTIWSAIDYFIRFFRKVYQTF